MSVELDNMFCPIDHSFKKRVCFRVHHTDLMPRLAKQLFLINEQAMADISE